MHLQYIFSLENDRRNFVSAYMCRVFHTLIYSVHNLYVNYNAYQCIMFVFKPVYVIKPVFIALCVKPLEPWKKLIKKDKIFTSHHGKHSIATTATFGAVR